jgi:hypothetical protein
MGDGAFCKNGNMLSKYDISEAWKQKSLQSTAISSIISKSRRTKHSPPYHGTQKTVFHYSKVITSHISRIWRDFGSALPLQTRLTQTKSILPLPNGHDSQVKDQGRGQCCYTKHKKFPYLPIREVSLLSGHGDIQYVYKQKLPVYRDLSY